MEGGFSLRFFVVGTVFFFQFGMASVFELHISWRYFLEFLFTHSSGFDGFFPYGRCSDGYTAAHWFSDGEAALSTDFQKAPGLFEAEGGWRDWFADWRTTTGGERQISSACTLCVH